MWYSSKIMWPDNLSIDILVWVFTMIMISLTSLIWRHVPRYKLTIYSQMLSISSLNLEGSIEDIPIIVCVCGGGEGGVR